MKRPQIDRARDRAPAGTAAPQPEFPIREVMTGRAHGNDLVILHQDNLVAA